MFAHTSLSIRAIGYHNYYYIQWDVTDKHTYIEFNIDPVRWTDWIYITPRDIKQSALLPGKVDNIETFHSPTTANIS